MTKQTQRRGLRGPSPPRKVAAGTAERTGWVRQASRQGGSTDCPEDAGLMEAVVERENMISGLAAGEGEQGSGRASTG